MSRRRIEALRRLAERPGTEHEGIAARAALERLEGKEPTQDQRGRSFASYLRDGPLDDLANALGQKKCHCGAMFNPFDTCRNNAEHERIRLEIARRFPKGTRVYYNRWAYTPNCAGTVMGYRKKGFAVDWAWVRVKFDHLKNTRDVPVYSECGWHLSVEPIEADARRPLRGGMEKIEDLNAAMVKVAEQMEKQFREVAKNASAAASAFANLDAKMRGSR